MNDENLNLIELVNNYLKNKKESATFEEIWNGISKDIANSSSSKDEIIAELYADLVLDNRFALTSEGMWGVREYLKFEDIKKQYDYVDQFENTEEFEDIDIENINDDYDEIDMEELNLEDIDDEEYVPVDEEEENEFNAEGFTDDEESVAEIMGITEEIDWDALEQEMKDNN